MEPCLEDQSRMNGTVDTRSISSLSPNHQVPLLPHEEQLHGGQYRQREVQDAISYLDAVKFRFASKPEVYKAFLVLMWHCDRSENIDTHQVLHEVVALFREHPDLIIGFNTFLGHGYRIEVHFEEQAQVDMSGPDQQRYTIQFLLCSPQAIS